MTDVASKFVSVGGRKLHYLEAGSGPPVLLLHGWPTNAQLWRRTLGPLSGKRRAIALDLPGFGKSDKPTDVRYSFRFFDEVLTGFLEAVGVEKTGLAVHDLGGPIGLHWAIKNPARITDLAVLNTLVFPETSWAVKLFVAATFVPGVREYISSPKGVRGAMRFGVQDKSKITPEIAALYSDPYEPRDARKALLKAGHGLAPKGLAETARGLSSLKVPVRLVYGEADRILPDVAKTMTRLKGIWPDAELTKLRDCGHFLQEDAGEEVARLLTGFFGRTSC